MLNLPIRSLGLDLSTKATGVVLLRETASGPPLLLLETEIKAATVGWQQKLDIVAQIMAVIDERKPAKIVLEGYSLNLQHSSSVVPLVELGGLLRSMLYCHQLKWFDPRASELKKFATGKGNSPKDVVMMHVLKRWGHESLTNNTADAYVCAAMGLAQANRLDGVTLAMRVIAGQMKINAT